MAIGLARNTTVIGVKTEVTEGTYLAPAAATEYVAPLSDGFDLTPAKELIERNVLTSSVGKITPRVGTKSVTASLSLEMKAKGVEGGDPQYGPLIKAALGSTHTVAAQNTTKAAGNTGSVLQIEDLDIADYQIGDILVVLEPGAHWPCAIASLTSGAGTATITVVPPKPTGVFSNSVVISKSTTHYPANSGHPTLSLSYYWANTIRESAVGCRVNSLAVENFTVGQIANFNFGLEGLSFDEVDGTAPHTPTFDSALPPLILRACLYQDGVNVAVNEFSVSVENTLGFLTSTCSENGKISSRITERALTGTFTPYKDDTSVAQFTKFNANTAYSLFISAYNPSAVTGEIEMGSVVGIYLPNCVTTEKVVADQDGLLSESINFAATRGTAGSVEEIYLGFV